MLKLLKRHRTNYKNKILNPIIFIQQPQSKRKNIAIKLQYRVERSNPEPMAT